jgi:hypothetical protein
MTILYVLCTLVALGVAAFTVVKALKVRARLGWFEAGVLSYVVIMALFVAVVFALATLRRIG